MGPLTLRVNSFLSRIHWCLEPTTAARESAWHTPDCLSDRTCSSSGTARHSSGQRESSRLDSSRNRAHCAFALLSLVSAVHARRVCSVTLHRALDTSPIRHPPPSPSASCHRNDARVLHVIVWGLLDQTRHPLNLPSGDHKHDDGLRTTA